jgi:hypothetical protein
MNPKLRPDIIEMIKRIWPERESKNLIGLCEVVAQHAVLDCADFLSERNEHKQAIAILEWSRSE